MGIVLKQFKYNELPLNIKYDIRFSSMPPSFSTFDIISNFYFNPLVIKLLLF